MTGGSTGNTPDPTISQVLREFLAEHRDRLAPRTFDRYERVIRLLERSLNGAKAIIQRRPCRSTSA